jgi:hypothetical protein
MVQHLWNPEHVTYRRYHKKRETKRSSHDVVEQLKKEGPTRACRYSSRANLEL